MNKQLLYLLQNLDCGKREMLVEYLGARGVLLKNLEELNERHTAYLCDHLKEVLFRAKAFCQPDEAFHDIAGEVLG